MTTTDDPLFGPLPELLAEDANWRNTPDYEATVTALGVDPREVTS